MQIAKTDNFVLRYQKLPKPTQKKIDKQIILIEKDFFYPSLRTKKLKGFKDWWEFRSFETRIVLVQGTNRVGPCCFF